MKFTTQTGSEYRVDLKRKTWTRLKRTEQSGTLRGESGIYFEISKIRPGRCVRMLCPPIHPSSLSTTRVVLTSVVTKVESERSDVPQSEDIGEQPGDAVSAV